MFRVASLLIALTVGVSSSRPSFSIASADWTAYLHHTGPIKIGMPLIEVRRVLRDPQAFLSGNDPEVPLDECAYLESKQLPKGLGLMFRKGIVVRIDIFEKGIRTASGAEVGDREDKIKRLYPGRITVEPHHYDPENGHYLNYTPIDPAERDYGIVFETENGVVTTFRVGTQAAIALVEGCS
jgi:hypothetical protein